jgi:hypothetical protein
MDKVAGGYRDAYLEPSLLDPRPGVFPKAIDVE